MAEDASAFIGRKEIEIKLRLTGLAEGRRRLREAGFRVVRRRVFEQNVILDTPGHALRRRGLLLRLRFNAVLVSLDPSGRIRGLNPGTAFRRAYEQLRTEGKASLPLSDFMRECAKGITSWDGRTWIPAEYAGGLNPDSARR